MALFRHEFPILEHDTDPNALIMNNHHPEILLPKRAVYVFLGDTVDDYAKQVGAEVIDVFRTIGRDTDIYRVYHKGEELCLCRAPLGGSAAVQLMDRLIGHGVKQIITAGSCGALAPLPENAFLIPTHALRDEGASYHYLPPAMWKPPKKSETPLNRCLPGITCPSPGVLPGQRMASSGKRRQWSPTAGKRAV